jgi:hypothetical protein
LQTAALSPKAFSHVSIINAAVNLDIGLDHGSGIVEPVPASAEA